jgi:hypothetical protein
MFTLFVLCVCVCMWNLPWVTLRHHSLTQPVGQGGVAKRGHLRTAEKKNDSSL